MTEIEILTQINTQLVSIGNFLQIIVSGMIVYFIYLVFRIVFNFFSSIFSGV